MHPYDRFTAVEYADELAELPGTFAVAINLDVQAFGKWLRENRRHSLIAVGAGGSLAIAAMAAALHERATGRVSRAAEPMDVYVVPDSFADTAVLHVTASGAHGDALEIGRRLPTVCDRPAIFCGIRGSTLEAETSSSIPVFAYPLLPQNHGWVAVNVLLGQAIVLVRAFQEAFPETFDQLPTNIFAFLPHGQTPAANAAHWATVLRSVLERRAIFVLYGPETKPLAVDLDSKFTEAGLGELSLSEYRNFAHGRYQSLLNRQDEVGVLAFYTAPEAPIALATYHSLPDWIPHAAIPIDSGSFALNLISQIVQLLVIVGAVGIVRGTDVNWGSRNTFGDPLYSASTATHSTSNAQTHCPAQWG